jgi:hypothetical protein
MADHWHADETWWLHFNDKTKLRWWLWVFTSTDAVAFVLDPSGVNGWLPLSGCYQQQHGC